MRKPLIAIALAIITAAVLAACGSSSSSTTQAPVITAAAATAPASQAAATQAAATQAPATTAPATTAPATQAPATTPAATAAAATTASAVAIAVAVPAWCINPRPVTPPGTLAEWLASDGYADAQYVQEALVELLAPYSTTANENAENRSLCQDVGFAKYAPPPVDVAGYTVALDEAIKASIALNNGTNAINQGEGEPSALAAAHPYLEAAETALKAFFAAVGHPVG
jgi:hypothetical protein